MQAALSWNPDHSLLATIQNERRHLQVSFLEKNGLRHGEFTITNPGTDLRVCYNSAGDLLAVYSSQRVELWTRSNYHWYCKQAWNCPIRLVQWDSVDPLAFFILYQVRLWLFFDTEWRCGHRFADVDLLV